MVVVDATDFSRFIVPVSSDAILKARVGVLEEMMLIMIMMMMMTGDRRGGRGD